MKNNHIMLVLTLLVSLLIIDTSFAQINKDSSKYEIGLGIADFSELFIYRTLTPNISFKYKFGQNAIRSGLTYSEYNRGWDENNGIYGYSVHEIIANIGYERRFFGPNIQMSAGGDFCFLQDKGKITSIKNNENYVIYHFGVGPVIGCIYNFQRNFSIQSELGLFWGYYDEKHYEDGQMTFTMSNFRNFTAQRVFSLHLYYNFGK